MNSGRRNWYQFACSAARVLLAVVVLLSALTSLGAPSVRADEPDRPRLSPPPPTRTVTTGRVYQTQTVKDPISAATGEYFFVLDLLKLGGPLPLDLSLYYGSQVDSKRLPDGLPFRFIGNHRGTLVVERTTFPTAAFVELGLGTEIGFFEQGAGWQPFPINATRYQLTETANAFYLLDPSGSLVYTFVPTTATVPLGTRVITMTSVSITGTAGSADSRSPSLSADGRFVAFSSSATNLISGDTGVTDVFVRDLLDLQTTRVSVSSSGAPGNGGSTAPSISTDGRYVAFISSSTNLVDGDTNGFNDIFVHDRQTGQATRVSVGSSGAQANGNSMMPRISGDGRYVAFVSSATNLVSGDTNGLDDVFVHDRQTGATTRVSVSSTGGEGTGGVSWYPAISADGRYVAFQSAATNLVTGDTNGNVDVFVHDRQTGATTRVNVSSTGAQANDLSASAAISGDGGYVAFESRATNLVDGDTNGQVDVFVHDRQTSQTTRVSVSSAGVQGNDRAGEPAISADGRYVAFLSSATSLVNGKTSNQQDLFLHDRQSGETVRVNVDPDGNETTASAFSPAISGTGRFLAFSSAAVGFGFDDANTADDVFVAKRHGPTQAFLRRVEDRNGNVLTYTNPANIGVQGPTRVADGLGRELTFTYATVGITDTNPYLTRIADQTGRAITLTYEVNPPDNPGAVTLRSITDPLGNTRTFRYAGSAGRDLITAQVMPLGNVPYTQTYNTSFPTRGVVAAQRDAYSNTTTIQVDSYEPYGKPQSKFTAISADLTKQVFTHTHDARVVQSQTDQTGRTIVFQPDATADRLTAVTDRLGYTTTISYHVKSGSVALVVNGRGETLSYTHTAQSQTFINPDTGEQVAFTFYDRTGIRYPDGTTEQFVYDPRGNLLSQADRGGNTWAYGYNSRGQVITATNPAGGVITNTYNADGTLAGSNDSDGNRVTYGYDALKRLSSTTFPDGSRVQYSYDVLDRIVATTDENGRTTTYHYDANGNQVDATDPAGGTTRFAYDLMDRLVRVTDRLGKATTYSYDAMGRLTSTTDPTGVATTYGYDARGWRTRTTVDGRTWEASYDDEGLVSAVRTPSGRTTRWRRDALGHPTAVVDALGQPTTLVRDAQSRLTSVTDPLRRTTGYAYDARGLLTGVTLPTGTTATYERDALGEIGRIVDLNGQSWTFSRSPLGRLRTETDPLGRTRTHGYDVRNRPAQTTYPDGATLTRSYDAAGQLVRQTLSDGTDIQTSFDARGNVVATSHLTLTRDAESRVVDTEDAGVRFGASYDDAGRLQTVSYASGTFTVTYSYSPTSGLLTGVTDSLAGARVDFTYDADFRLTDIGRSNGVGTIYTLDDADRVTRIRDGTFLDLEYTLDAAGQAAGLTLTAPLDPSLEIVSGQSSLAVDAASQVTGTGRSVDLRGREAVAPDRGYSWDGASRLTGAGSAILTYNGFGDVRTRTEAGSTTHFSYNHAIGLAPVVAEREAASGSFQRYYVWTPDGQLLYGIDVANGNRVFFYHFDRTGSTLALTDATGLVTDAYAYTPYGKLLARQGSTRQPFTFVGQYGVRQEGSSGALYQMRARYYDATTGRFLSREPLWPQMADPRELNPYQYALADPIGLADVLGQSIYKSQPTYDRSNVRWLMEELTRRQALVPLQERALEAAEAQMMPPWPGATNIVRFVLGGFQAAPSPQLVAAFDRMRSLEEALKRNREAITSLKRGLANEWEKIERQMKEQRAAEQAKRQQALEDARRQASHTGLGETQRKKGPHQQGGRRWVPTTNYLDLMFGDSEDGGVWIED